MADSTEAAADAQLTFKVKASGGKNHQITMAETATILDLKTKLAGEEFENIPVERQRLIYSGRVMKNEDTLASYKVKSGHTIHLVKSAASNPTPPASGSTPTPAAVPTNMSAGTANNVLAGLTGARYAGHVNLPSRDIFGADGGMGAPPNEEQLANMMSDPATAQALNEALDNPTFLDHLVNSNPYLRNIPNAREMFRSPMLRSMLSNPDYIRQAMRLQRQLGGGGLGGAGGFPAPGATDTTPAGAPASGAAAGTNPNAAMPPNPFAMGMDPFAAMFGPGAAGAAGQGGAAGSPFANPFAALFPPPAAPAAGATGQAPPATAGTPGTTAASGNAAAPRGAEGAAAAGTTGGAPQDAANPFASLFGPPQMTPEMMQQMMQMWGAMGGPGAGAAAAPPDNRPPEERYADQLRQLNDMGFFDFDRNVAALRRSGGSVQGAIEHLLSG